ncbi:dihydrofolate reductase family protein [Emticicia sp. 17c]|uniref:dihydrofolate reductase family protein n=1 Tax=Emticicia sp. 17c TaxID=3127704 RepID=UPI00301DF3C9
MRKLILGVAVSLDSYIEGPNGEYDWCFTDQDYGLNEFYTRIDTVFVGRKSYEMSFGIEGGADAFPKMKEYVFSNTLTSVKEGTMLISGDIKTAVEKIKQEEGKDIWLFGGASLTSTLMQLHLVDELWLSVHPIILGQGKPLFQDIKERTNLQLVESKVYDTGLVSLKYIFV